jgi:arylsulfatase A-like enzyme
MRCDEAIINAIDHLNSFKQRDNFIWLTLFDTHHFLDGLPNISIQSEMDLSLHDYNYSAKKSVHADFDSTRKKIYELELKRIDIYLKLLFDFINDNYHMDDVLVSICSDHGKGFLGNSSEMLAEHRIKVPMLFKSNNTKNTNFEGLSQGVDYLPTMLNLAGISYTEKFDGRDILKEGSQYALTEVIYNEDFYQAVINDKEFTFTCKSNNRIKSQEQIDFEDCFYEVFSVNENIKVHDNANNLITKYKNILKSH